jgi:hypothetical protein
MLVIFSFILAFFHAGCIEETLSQPDNGIPVVEKTLEELEKEKEMERVRKEEAQRAADEQKREERLMRENALREELGYFYVPLPPEGQVENPSVRAKAIYLTGHTVGRDRFYELLALVESTELNAVVIDVKNDHGMMSYPSEIEIVREVGANRSSPVKDIHKIMDELKERDIYPIARIVVFRDPHLSEQKPEWSIQKNGGGLWKDHKGFAWVNPYERNVWNYNIAIAKEAALMGFREIQFDYVRFPENAKRVDREAFYPGSNDMVKEDAIKEFLLYARDQLQEYNVRIAADVFGVIATSWGDSDQIGQNWEKIAPTVDYICPMIYPSHYGPGYFGFAVPDANPAGTVRNALSDAIKRNAPLSNPPIIRPWLQSFTAPWVKGYIRYGVKEVRQQIDTALELGIDEFMIWNAGNNYIYGSFLPLEEASLSKEKALLFRDEKGLDILGRTGTGALEAFMEAIRQKNWRNSYVLHSTGFTMNHDDYREWMEGWAGRLFSYEITEKNQSGEILIFTLNVTVLAGEGKKVIAAAPFEVYKENHVWRVSPSEEVMDRLVHGSVKR